MWKKPFFLNFLTWMTSICLVLIIYKEGLLMCSFVQRLGFKTLTSSTKMSSVLFRLFEFCSGLRSQWKKITRLPFSEKCIYLILQSRMIIGHKMSEIILLVREDNTKTNNLSFGHCITPPPSCTQFGQLFQFFAFYWWLKIGNRKIKEICYRSFRMSFS